MPEFYEWTVKITVPSYMVAQGEVLDIDRAEQMVHSVFPEPISDGDLKARIVKAPKDEDIRREQA